MKASIFGKIIEEEWLKMEEIRENISLGEYIIMPDHFHAIIQINEQIKKDGAPLPGEFKSPSNSIGAIIRGFKGASTKRIKFFLYNSGDIPSTGELPFAPTEEEIKILNSLDPNKSIWQRNYYERIIRSASQLENTITYIRNNPLNWEEKKMDEFSRERK